MFLKRRFGTVAVGGGLTFLMLVGIAGVARAEEPGAAPAGAGGAGREGHARNLRLRAGRRDCGLQAEQSRLVRRQPAVASAERRQPVRQRRPLLPERAAEPPGREGGSSDGQRAREGAVRDRHVRRGPRRRPDDDPVAPCLGPVEAGRRGPDEQPVHGRRCLPERPRLLGPERDAVLPQRAGLLGTVQRRQLERAHRDRSAGRERGRGRALRPRGTAEREAAVSRRRISPGTIASAARNGGTSSWAAPFARSPTTTSCPTTSST